MQRDSLHSRPTLKDVAARTRLSISAVSLALRNPGALPATTAARVKKAAEDLGYQPDPALSALAAYRTRQRTRREFSIIACVSNWAKRDEWLRRPSAQRLLEGAMARANALGYQLQHFWAREGGASPRRFSRMLVNRGIRGVILAPFEHPETPFELEWENFAVVAIERPALYARFHHIMPNYFADMLLAWEQLRARGYQRIGLVIEDELAKRVAHQWEAAHGYEQVRSGRPPVPTLLLRRDDPPTVMAHWASEHRPDAVISRGDSVFQALQAIGIRIPDQLGYVSLNVIDDAPGVSGICQLRDRMGAAAVDAVNALLLVSQRGPSDFSRGTHIDGVWREGRTLPRRRSAKRAPSRLTVET